MMDLAPLLAPPDGCKLGGIEARQRLLRVVVSFGNRSKASYGEGSIFDRAAKT